MIFIDTTNEEETLIKDHLMSLITPKSRNDKNETILDKYWKNWYQIYKDYQYYLQLINIPQFSESILNSCSRFNPHSKKYVGLSFYHYFNYVMDLNIYNIHSCNNTYVGQSNEIGNENIKGNEKYEVCIYFLIFL